MRPVSAAVLLALLRPGTTAVRAESCPDLWRDRNAIDKAAGYCFKTGRAIRTFGNAGCQYDDIRDVPLSARDRALVDRFVSEEAALGCTP